MSLFRHSLLISLVLLLGAGRLLASEQHEFDVAATAFKTGMWSRAEVEFAEFIEKHPQSDRAPQAALYQAQADFQQGKLQDALAVLRARESSAGALADEFVYWIGMVQFQNRDYSNAADSFARLTRIFPESQKVLDGVVNEAAARSKLNQWPRVADLLQNNIFQEAARTNATDSRVLNGHLLLAESLLAQHHPDSATAVLRAGEPFKNNAELDWRRSYLLSHARLAAGDTNEALALSGPLIAGAGRPELRAQAVADQANILENMGRISDALEAYGENLTNNAPGGWQRQAILKIADLSAAQTNFSNAEKSLEMFLTRFSNSPEADSALLALGELHLKSYVATPSANSPDLPQAQSCFDQLTSTWTNSPLLGKAFLDRGWCYWIQGKWGASAADFQAATAKLPFSVDLAVAHFKLGDAQFRLGNWSDARANYQAVVNDFTNFPVVNGDLGAQALYQTLRVCLDIKDVPGMSNAMAQILKIYPLNNVAEKGILLVGEGLSSGLGEPKQARALFERFEQVFPNSEQLPEVEWAVARTYEQESNWVQAIASYDSWVRRFSGNTNLAAVKYARAWANYEGGHETNAFILFTNFLSEYPSNSVMTPVAEWWLGDYYSSRGDWQDAEFNYQLVFQFTPPSSLTEPAILMAGRAAMGRQAYENAKDYFKMLMAETNCPTQLPMQTWLALCAQAWFACGDVMMQEPSPDPNTPLTNYLQAIPYFEYVCTEYPGSEQAALAWGEIGDCYFQLAGQTPQYYTDATNAYTQVITSTGALIPERSQAQVGIGMVCEKLAALTNGVSQFTLLHTALDNYLDVFFGNNLRNGETADPLWVKKSGLQALPLIESMGTGDPDKFIDQMEIVLPQLRSSLEKKRLELPRPVRTQSLQSPPN
ncbi:MAG TPA: tetratricopeptide repeat protein [Verrucomicrobiae bacterium]|jgi:TolA-binding protein|nr:tetratricopeptide repeat protein [Verrucomicrobiae bacterium]